MKIRNIFKYIAVACLFPLMTSSCSDWLAVDMEDGIMEDKLYETNEGYLSVLNGAYTKMNEVYASTLGMGVIDVMAQYYNIAQNSNHRYYVYANYNFEESSFETTSGNLWTGLYELIANLNSLLEHCDSPDAAILPSYYSIVKGEALALRAMYHFDLLRVYGPIYSAETENTEAIPYQETTSKEIQPILSAKEVLDKVIRDLEAAAELLQNDPIRTEGVLNSDSDDPNETADFRYRQFRLNYYAVQTLLARAYLWRGDRATAYNIARGIITENDENAIFPWTPRASAQQSSNPDRIFSSEVIFSLYNLSRVNLYNSHFSRSASISNSFTFVGDDMADTYGKMPYFYPDVNDIRRGTNMWSIETLEETSDNGSQSSQTALCFSKYADIATTSTIRYMIPLMRMSEVYLIAAECTDDLTEAVGYINAIRQNRNCVDLTVESNTTQATVQDYITNEFAREVIGEGQLYFYYKRHAMTRIMSGTSFSSWSTTYSIDLADYVWPLPDVETDRRVTSNN